MTKKYYCPRCKNEKIIDYSISFECPICKLEFEKGDFELFTDDDILSIEEKHQITKVFNSDLNNE